MQLPRPLSCSMVLALLLFASASSLSGQGPRLPPAILASRVSLQPARLASLPDSSGVKQTYWAEGGLIGAVGGLLLSSLMSGWCEGSGCHNDRTTIFMLVGGFVIGALVGGGIEKKS